MVAAVATDDPEIAEKPAQAPMLARPRPPRTEPNQTLKTLNRSAEMPEFRARTPITTKSGITAKLRSDAVRNGESASRRMAGLMPTIVA